MTFTSLSGPRVLGFAGLLPQLACLLAAWFGGPEWRYSALAIGWAYAALIFSFLGGMWWGLAAGAQARGAAVPHWLWIAAVVPSLLALATIIPWLIGQPWPGPSLMLLGIGIAVSPLLVDRHLSALTPEWWMGLRWILSIGLGTLSFFLGFAG